MESARRGSLQEFSYLLDERGWEEGLLEEGGVVAHSVGLKRIARIAGHIQDIGLWPHGFHSFDKRGTLHSGHNDVGDHEMAFPFQHLQVPQCLNSVASRFQRNRC